MLLDKYLPAYHFRSRHELMIEATSEDVWPLVDNIDFTGSRVIRILSLLRGLPSKMLRKDGLSRARFIELERVDASEVAIGLIGKFWKLSGDMQSFQPSEFKSFPNHDFAKAIFNFHIQPVGINTRLLTETRIQIEDTHSRRMFSLYWFVIRHFSGWIRWEMLRVIKKKAEARRKLTLKK